MFKDGEQPAITIRVENISDQPREVRMESLAPTLLANKKAQGIWSPADGASMAVITRAALWNGGSSDARMQGRNDTWSWKVESPKSLEQKTALGPKSFLEIRLSFNLPPNEYDFLAGYGGGVHAGQCIASNLVAFDVKPDKTAVNVAVPGR